MTTSAEIPERSPRPGSEDWSASGSGERGRTGILLVHGFAGSPVSLRPLGELLAARGFAIELPRLPGHGTTWRDMVPTRYEDWRAHVEARARAFAERVTRVVLVGLSMGGTLALDVASGSGAKIAGVVSINAQILDRTGIVVKLGRYLEKILAVVPPAIAGLTKNDVAKPDVGEHAYGWVPSAAGNSLLRALPRVRAQLAHMPVPVVVVYSRNDHCVSPENSKALLRMIQGPELSELVLERSYHVATLDYDLPLIEERVVAFADRLTLS